MAEDAGPPTLDFIGDVHGCGDALEALLEQLGYRSDGAVWSHPESYAVFVGDIVDRGPQVRRALNLVRGMVEAGAAELLLGNHEYNLIGHFEPAPPGSGREYLRPHTPRALRGLAATLDDFRGHEDELRDHVAWLRRRPLCWESQRARAVHACWDERWCGFLRARPQGFVLTDDDWLACGIRGHDMRRCVDRLLNGTVHPLPEGLTYRDPHGIERRQVRTKFWSERALRLGDLVVERASIESEVLEVELDPTERRRIVNYEEDARPLFFGHYWFRGEPTIVRANLACLDYSAVLGGRLVAYRFRGEPSLSDAGFVSVPGPAATATARS